MWEAIIHGLFGDKNKGYQREFRCVYALCPSNQPHVGAYPPKMKFIQKIQPSVSEYRCKSCGCLINVSVETLNDGRQSWKINPSLIGGKPSYITNWRR